MQLALKHRTLTLIALALTAATLLLAAPSAHAAKKWDPVTQLIVINKSIGGVKLGQSAAKAKAAWASAAKCTNAAPGLQYCRWTGKNPDGPDGHADYTLKNGKVILVAISCGIKNGTDYIGKPLNKLKTKKSIRLGSTSKQVMDAYPGGQVVNAVGANGTYVHSYRLNANHTNFYFSETKGVTSITFSTGLLGY